MNARQSFIRRLGRRGALAVILLATCLLALPALAQRKPAERRSAIREARQERREALAEARGDSAGRREDVAAFVRQTFPDLARRLERLRRENPALFQRKRQEVAREGLRLLELRDRNPELFELSVEEIRLRDELGRLAAECRRESDADRLREKREALREQVGRAFDLRQRLKAGEVADLERKLADLRDAVERRAERRDELIDKKLSELLREDEDSDW